jgi:hypothetical protein
MYPFLTSCEFVTHDVMGLTSSATAMNSIFLNYSPCEHVLRRHLRKEGFKNTYDKNLDAATWIVE